MRHEPDCHDLREEEAYTLEEYKIIRSVAVDTFVEAVRFKFSVMERPMQWHLDHRDTTRFLKTLERKQCGE